MKLCRRRVKGERADAAARFVAFTEKPRSIFASVISSLKRLESRPVLHSAKLGKRNASSLSGAGKLNK